MLYREALSIILKTSARPQQQSRCRPAGHTSGLYAVQPPFLWRAEYYC